MEKLDISCTVLPPHPTRYLFGYRDDLATAITNLMDNAIYWLDHHAVANPSIQISFTEAGDECHILIADNGRGIPSEFTGSIFDVGFSLKPHGTGLGLSIAREAIQRSGGNLELLASAVGTTFRISFPLQ
jgi:signal transduction histidine kinase